MNSRFFKLKFLLLFLANIILLSSFVSALDCCYDSSLGIVFQPSGCSDSQIKVGEHSNIYGDNYCKLYVDSRKCWVDGNSLQISTYQGSKIFEISGVVYPISARSLTLVNFSNLCVSTSSDIINSGDNDGSSGGSVSFGDPEDFPTTVDDTYFDTQNLKYCQDAGGNLGFFVSKNACESASTADFTCVYNPLGVGFFSTIFSPSLDSGLFDQFEINPCLPKISINTCFDYKTNDSCIEDINELGCFWRNSEEYKSDTSLFDKKTGICMPLSDYNLDKHFNDEFIGDRINLIENPSFEDLSYNWQGISDSEIISDSYSFHGNNYALIDSLSSNTQISQDISKISSNLKLTPSIAVMPIEINSQSKLSVSVLFYDNQSSLISASPNLILTYDDLKIPDSTNGTYFKLLNFGVSSIFTIPENSYNLTIIIEVENAKLAIDAVSLQVFSESESININNLIFSPVSIIDSKASNCEKCFEEYGLNYCTSKKSSFLGDCSYMVENSSSSYSSKLGADYLGISSNIYSINEPWKSQSLSNDKLFCELYIDENSCINSSNYVNSKFKDLHFNLNGNNLCKWDNNFGCFKDSNNDNVPDIKLSFPKLYSFNSSQLDYFNSISSYNKTSDHDNQIFSDFELSCDLVPPISNIYFTGFEVDSDISKVLETQHSNMVGNVFVNLDVKDFIYDSCKDFNIDNYLYIDYKIENDKGLFSNNLKISNNQFSFTGNIKDFFIYKDISDNLISAISNGVNDIYLSIYDQSGNLEQEYSYKFDIDANGPEINLTNPTETIPNSNFLGSLNRFNSNFEFNISDYSNVKSCTFNLDNLDNSLVQGLDYSSEINFTQTNFQQQNFNFNLTDYLFNTSSGGNTFKIIASCVDIYNQETTQEYSFIVDFDTSLLLYSPTPFHSNDFEVGFVNDSFIINFISVEYNLNSCTLNYNSKTDTLAITKIATGFSVPEIPSVLFYSNISASILASDLILGENEFTINCSDDNSNLFDKTFKYVFDNVKPTILNYSLNGNKIIFKNGNYYTITDNNFFDITIDGTSNDMGSTNIFNYVFDFISSDYSSMDVSLLNFFPILSQIKKTDELDSLKVTNFNIDKNILTTLYDLDLFELRYNLTFFDKSGNSNTDIVKFYYDVSSPSLNFSGDVFSKPGFDILFTQSLDPNFEVTFSAPSYRDFNCSLKTTVVGYNYRKDFNSGANFNFKLSDLSDFDLTKSDLNLNFYCVDDYNFIINKDYTIHYDNINPILDDITLSKSNNIYFKNGVNIDFPDLIDKVFFNLKDTNEMYLECSYRFKSENNLYSCNESLNKISFNNNQVKSTDNLNILKGSFSTDNSICVRTSDFLIAQNQALANDNILKTSLVLEGFCEDGVGLKTSFAAKNILIDYVENSLADLSFEFRDGLAYPVVMSLYNYQNIYITSSLYTTNSLLTLSNPVEVSPGLYKYTSNVGLDTQTSFPNSIAYAIVFDINYEIVDFISETLIVDNENPTTYLNIYDEVEGFVYSDTFEIDFGASDVESGISKVEMFINDVLVYDSNNLAGYNANYLENPDTSYNYLDINKNYFGKVIFKNGTIGESYEIEVKSYDLAGNVDSKIIIVEIKDGIGIILTDSSNSFVTQSKFSWGTKVSSPIISFRTTKQPDHCLIYPLIDEEWEEITLNGDISNSFLRINGGVDFEYDLSQLVDFDLNLLSKNINPVKISCFWNNTYYDYTRNIQYLNFLPDYVANFTNGVVFTDDFRTLIEINSVGPYKYITCEYTINDGAFIDILGERQNKYSLVTDFSYLTDGVHEFKLKCVDIAGNIGPIKIYEFIVDKNSALSINDFKLVGTENQYIPDSSNNIYISEDSLIADFNLNLNVGTDCSYSLNPTGNFITSSINYIKNLVGIGFVDINMSSTNAFNFKSENINFENGSNLLKIECSSIRGRFDETFNVYYSNSTLITDFNLIRE